jgi:HSP20 family protein
MAVFRAAGGHPLGQLRHELDRIVSDLTRNLPIPSAPGGAREFPAVNLWETDQELFAEAELPGVKLDQLEIYAVGSELTIRGNRPGDDFPGGAYHRRERGVGKFSRVIPLPAEVNPDLVEASLRNGVLEVRLPKAEAAKPRKIQVKVTG